MKNMTFATVGNVVIALHTSSAPTDEEWTEYTRAVKAMDITKVKPLAFSDGGGPDSKQRKQLNDVLASRPGRAALVTSSTLARSVVTALSWFNPLVKAFAPDEVAQAFDYLQLDSSEVQAVRGAIRMLAGKFTPPLKSVVL